jgi:hypothetical protein
MSSVIRVNSITNQSGLGTVTLSNTGVVIAGITTISDLRTTGGTLTVGTGASIFSPATNVLTLGTGSSERARIDSSGRLLVGVMTARTGFFDGVVNPLLQVEGSTSGDCSLSVTRNSNDADGPRFILGRSRGTGNTIVQSGDRIGGLTYQGNDGAKFVRAAEIECYADSAVGVNSMPGRLVFSTTAAGASIPTERMRIRADGSIEMGKADSGDKLAVLNAASGSGVISAYATNGSYASTVIYANANRAANTAYNFIRLFSGDFGDVEFNLRGDGTGLCDGTWTGGGADYAEYFEWSDGNPDKDDRRGISVVLDGEKIRPAEDGEDPIGVISGNPSVVGDAAWNKWSGKYLRDEFGTYILEDYEVEDEDGNTVVQQRRKLNPAYDPDAEYISREQRPEWDCVGLMGKLRLRKGQPTGNRWIKMRDISDSVEEWLIR